MNMQTLVAALIVALLVASGCKPSESAQGSTTPQEVKVQDVARDYAKLTSMTPKPVFVNPELAMLCRGASQKEVETAAKTLGPHAHTSVRIFMNDQAAEAFKQKSPTYPVGSIVVKEKQGLQYWGPNGFRDKTSKTHSGVGGMIKRAKGYDPDHGDWEYFYFEDAAKIESGKIASCVQCHAGAAEKDYIFGNWAKAAE
jgi:hypothetical protein